MSYGKEKTQVNAAGSVKRFRHASIEAKPRWITTEKCLRARGIRLFAEAAILRVESVWELRVVFPVENNRVLNSAT